MSYLVAKDLKKSFKGKEVVRGVSLKVESGEIVGLLGPNGAGKTTSFYMIAGFLTPDSGKICIDGEDITELDVSERARLGIIYLPQESSVFRRLSVRDNFKLVLERLDKTKRKKLEEKLEHYIGLFNLEGVLNQKAYTLSGGQKRKVEVVRALLVEPKFILLDEPFAGIDPIGISQLKKIFEVLRDENIGILISDHNVRDTLKICNKGYVIAEGQIIGEGSPEEILTNPLVKQKYLGEEFVI
ncbi:MAG: LPS export ABC transporter ATP-binding protein [Thermodesulfobacteria bacterium]|nr:LPS export ABC transporter ATP-binding protein [Thermodesulfobacteriota bacterium]